MNQNVSELTRCERESVLHPIDRIPEATHEPCCTSHNRRLCCRCYRRTHFVEIRPCCGVDAALLEVGA